MEWNYRPLMICIVNISYQKHDPLLMIYIQKVEKNLNNRIFLNQQHIEFKDYDWLQLTRIFDIRHEYSHVSKLSFKSSTVQSIK